MSATTAAANRHYAVGRDTTDHVSTAIALPAAAAPGPTIRSVGNGNSAIASFAAALNNEEFSDVTFLVSGPKERAQELTKRQPSSPAAGTAPSGASSSSSLPQRVHCHRAILAARSPIFKRMLYDGWKETTQKEIEIHEFESAHFYIVLEWAYTGQTRMSAKDVLGVLQVALFYGFEDLAKDCQQLAVDFIDSTNVIVLLEAAIELKEHDIERAALEYIGANMKVALSESLLTTTPVLGGASNNSSGAHEMDGAGKTSDAFDRTVWSRLSLSAVERILSLEVMDCDEGWIFGKVVDWVEAAATRFTLNEQQQHQHGGGGKAGTSPTKPTFDFKATVDAERRRLYLALMPYLRLAQMPTMAVLMTDVKKVVMACCQGGSGALMLEENNAKDGNTNNNVADAAGEGADPEAAEEAVHEAFQRRPPATPAELYAAYVTALEFKLEPGLHQGHQFVPRAPTGLGGFLTNNGYGGLTGPKHHALGIGSGPTTLQDLKEKGWLPFVECNVDVYLAIGALEKIPETAEYICVGETHASSGSAAMAKIRIAAIGRVRTLLSSKNDQMVLRPDGAVGWFYCMNKSSVRGLPSFGFTTHSAASPMAVLGQDRFMWDLNPEPLKRLSNDASPAAAAQGYPTASIEFNCKGAPVQTSCLARYGASAIRFIYIR